MEPYAISLAVEDQLSEAVLKKILSMAENRFFVAGCYSRRGFGYLKKNIAGFNNAAKVRHRKREAKESGLCGIWKDERPAVEIIKESR